jgi:uncharacterized membrane protein YcaP (DUF421 family)
MEAINQIFGVGRDLSVLQMISRTIVVFVIALVLIRVSGRRSFGLHTPLDNIITIILGAVMSRAIVGASDFIPVIASSAIMVLMHRFFAYLMVHYNGFSKLVAGEKMLLFKDGNFIGRNMNRTQVCKEDILQEVRKTTLTEDLTGIEKIYIERNGEVSLVKK